MSRVSFEEQTRSSNSNESEKTLKDSEDKKLIFKNCSIVLQQRLAGLLVSTDCGVEHQLLVPPDAPIWTPAASGHHHAGEGRDPVVSHEDPPQ